ncbi:MAG: ABC transporter substrate-binding protein [Acidilobaceae archaeon]
MWSTFVGINAKKVSDVRVRWAMNMAVNREAIVKELLTGAATIATSPLSHYIMGSAQ